MPRTTRRVVCGLLEVMTTFSPTSALVRVDLPAFGRPTKATKPGAVRSRSVGHEVTAGSASGAGLLRSSRCRRVAGQVGRHGVDDRGQRYGDQRAEDAGDHGADGDDHDDGERVHPHQPAHQERLQHVALELLHRHHAAQHDQRRDRADRDQGDGDRGDAADRRTDDRDEGAEEDQHAQRHDERQPEDHGDQRDARARRWRR